MIVLLAVTLLLQSSLTTGIDSFVEDFVRDNKINFRTNVSNVIDVSMDKDRITILKQMGVTDRPAATGSGNSGDGECRSLTSIKGCINQMQQDRRDTSEFQRSLEVSCCIYSKLMDCLIPLAPDCGNDTIPIIDKKLIEETRMFDATCRTYEYPSARCWIFFHQWCFFALVFVSLTAFGLVLAGVATQESRRRRRMQDRSRAAMAMSRINEAGIKPHGMEFPPPPSYQECVENRV